ncbi:hypothetical protein [Paenirhodobacter populi]|uniref:hypothetical protein n=1 Tax=Paenirhodobacter populi TaxID=2306993 RepID=UPI0013E3D961|nr:hypothetical protein [Sinirhodobacter populi]
MRGLLLGLAGTATTRLGLWLAAIAFWLLMRPGGWAVLAAAVLVGVKLFPAPAGN